MVSMVPQGRTGNFLFELAAVIGYAKKHNLDFTVPMRTNDPKWNPIYFPHLVNRKWNPKLPHIVIQEQGHAYQTLPFEEAWRSMNIILKGYWQSEKYFIDYRDDILKAFNIPYQRNKGTVSIHVRRGDYLQLRDKHPEVSLDWYMEAVDYFADLGFQKFLVFSDDIVWCKENFKGYLFSFSEGNKELKDLELASSCEHNICSSSTYAFWIYWLNRNEKKIGVFPKLWFVEGHGGLDTSDILPPEIIKM